MGAVSELVACADLLMKGFSVFRSVSPASFYDLIAIKNDLFLGIEIKTGRYSKSGKLYYPEKNIKGKCLIVYTDSDNKLHYVTHPELCLQQPSQGEQDKQD